MRGKIWFWKAEIGPTWYGNSSYKADTGGKGKSLSKIRSWESENELG